MVSADIQHHVYLLSSLPEKDCAVRFYRRRGSRPDTDPGRHYRQTSAVQRRHPVLHWVRQPSRCGRQCVLLDWVAPVIIVGLSLLYLCVVGYSLCVSIPPLPPLPVTEDLGSGIAWDETCETTCPRQSCRGGNASAVFQVMPRAVAMMAPLTALG